MERTSRRSPVNVLLVVALPVVLVLAWWLLSRSSTSVFFPPLSKILQSFKDTWLFSRVGSDVVPTLYRLALGFGLACVLGVALGTLLGRMRRVDDAISPLLQFVRAIPAVALIPIAIVLLGVGDVAKVVLIAFCCVFPILLGTVDGVRNVEPGLEDVGRSFRLTPTQRLFSVLLPSAAPQIFAGMRTSLGFAFILGIITEMTGSTNGVGFVTVQAQQSFDIPRMWAGMILLGILGTLLNVLFGLVERRVLGWHHASKAGS